MLFFDYLKDRIWGILCWVLWGVLVSMFLLSVGNTIDTVCVVFFASLFCSVIFMGIAFLRRKQYLEELLRLTEGLSEKYLIAEVMKKPLRSDDAIFYRMIKICNKSMLEKVGETQTGQKEYKEYIEQWVHEIKTPVTAIKLLCENQKSDLTKLYLAELEKINHYIEQTLYYARSEHIEKDYLIREIRLVDIIHQAIAENKQLLLQNQVKIEIEDCEMTAFTDEKWMVFIFNQLIQNAVKYRREESVLSFRCIQEKDRELLCLEDNGIGIPAEDLPRIFEKGFTGKNGREERHATGMGLYLCKRLCDNLGVGITAQSDGENGSQFQIIFYKNQFLTEL